MRYFGVWSTNFFSFSFFSRHKILCNHLPWTVTPEYKLIGKLDKLNAVPGRPGTFFNGTFFFRYKNHFCKNVEDEICPQI